MPISRQNIWKATQETCCELAHCFRQDVLLTTTCVPDQQNVCTHVVRREGVVFNENLVPCARRLVK